MQGPWYTFEEAQELLSFNRSELLHEIDAGSIRPVVTTKQRSFLVFKRDENQHWLGLGACRYRGCLTLHADTIANILENGEVNLRTGSGRFLEPHKVTNWSADYPFKQQPPFETIKKWYGGGVDKIDLGRCAVTPLPEEKESSEVTVSKLMNNLGRLMETIASPQTQSAPKQAEDPYLSDLAAKAEARPAMLDFKTNSLFKKEDLRIAASEIERFKTAVVPALEEEEESQPVKQTTSRLEGKRTSLLYELFFRAIEANPSATAKQLWCIIQDDWESDSPLYDIESIITNMDESCVEWRSDHYNDQALKRSSFAPVLSKLKKQL